MKKLSIVFLIGLFIATLFADNTFYLFLKNNSVIIIPSSTIDSVTFTNDKKNLLVNKTDKSIDTYSVADIDSMKLLVTYKPVITDVYPLAANPGDTITILGSYLYLSPSIAQSGTKVNFGNTCFTKVSSGSISKIKVQVPVDLPQGKYDISIFNGTGYAQSNSCNSPYQFTVTHKSPSWKILCLVIDTMDFTYTDNGINHRLIGSTTNAQRTLTDKLFNTYITTDFPKLTSGMMRPTGTVRHINLTHTWTSYELSSVGGVNNLFPLQSMLGANDDRTFDGIIVVFPQAGQDVLVPGTRNFSSYGGQTPNNGTNRTYATISTNRISSSDRNVFIHEFGHSITFYYYTKTYSNNSSCLGPNVNWGNLNTYNHIGGSSDPFNGEWFDYLRNKTYVISDDITILRSIYNNEYGFSHDYYSGFIGDTKKSGVSYGVGQQQWDMGGPITKK